MKPIACTALTALGLLSATTALCEDVTGKTYRFSPPHDVTSETQKNVDRYTFKWGKAPHGALLMIYVSPIPYNPKTFKYMADTLERTVERQMRRLPNVADIDKKRTEINVGPFKGAQIELIIKYTTGGTIRSYSFNLHDGSRVWSGQLTAHAADDIEKAHAIMKSARSVADKAVDGDKK